MKKSWRNLKVTILGLSKTGIASAKYLSSKGAACTVSDNRPVKPEDEQDIQSLKSSGITVEMGENNQDTLLASDLIVTSPGIPPKSEVIKFIRANNIELIGEPELAYLETSIPIVAITGTNGKSTTTTLISEIFTLAGYKAPTCGNIGYPIIDELSADNDYLIAEISSFQLEYSPSFKPQIGVFLNYTPDHIDWHGDAQEYLRVKSDFLIGSRSPAWAVLNACDPAVVAFSKQSQSDIYWFGLDTGSKSCFISDETLVIKENNMSAKVLPVKDVQIKGYHNLENIMASIATARIAGIDTEIIADAVRNFKGISHRIEYVAAIGSVEFYNDSKATNCDAAICALKAFGDDKVVLIAGGRDKGTDLSEFVQQIKLHANAVVLIGEAAERFEEALRASGYLAIYNECSMEAAIEKAFSLNAGSVLLSPACASYDMFKNFEERGNVFKTIVKKKQEQVSRV